MTLTSAIVLLFPIGMILVAIAIQMFLTGADMYFGRAWSKTNVRVSPIAG